MTTDERLKVAERQINSLADMVEQLVRERHKRENHDGAFPAKRVGQHGWCRDDLCNAAYELATMDRL